MEVEAKGKPPTVGRKGGVGGNRGWWCGMLREEPVCLRPEGPEWVVKIGKDLCW